MNNADEFSWTYKHITVNDIGLFVAWDETQSGEIGRFEEFDEAVIALVNYANHLESSGYYDDSRQEN